MDDRDDIPEPTLGEYFMFGIALLYVLIVNRWIFLVMAVLVVASFLALAFYLQATCHHIYYIEGYVKLANGHFTPNYEEKCIP